MTTPTTINPDWRKQAATRLNDEEVEVAFMRQAFTHIESKAAPLLRDTFFLGFEVVDKNDANTNIIGLFVFRVDKALLYAPAFFKNGRVKGANLLYDTNNKLFTPLNPEWCNYYVGKYSESTGRMVDQGMQMSRGRSINFQNLISPESLSKRASERTVSAWTEMQQQHQKQATEGTPLLTELLASTHGADAFQKLASAVDENFNFAQAMVESYTDKQWLTAPLGRPQEKRAAVTEPGTLTIHVGSFNPNARVSVERQFRLGYSIEDTRPETITVYEDFPQRGEPICEAGVYRVVDHAGDTKELFVVPNVETVYADGCDTVEPYRSDDEIFKSPLSPNNHREAGYKVQDSYYSNPTPRHLVYSPSERSLCLVRADTIYGESADQESPLKAVDSIRKGQLITLVAGKRVLESPQEVVAVERDENITRITITDYGHKQEILVNTDRSGYCTDTGVWGADTQALVSAKEPTGEREESDPVPCCGNYTSPKRLDFVPATLSALMDFLCDNEVTRTTVKQAGTRLTITQHGRQTRELNKFAAAAVLARDLRIHGDVAQEIVERALSQGEHTFLTEKQAAVRLVGDVDPEMMMIDSEMGVPEDSPESYTLDTESDHPEPVDHATGDQYRMDGMRVMIETGTPEQLYEASQEIKDDSLFDLGVVGSLVKTFDSGEMIERFIPDLRQGLDKVGRILFLIYWKPENFVESYGADDISEIESKLLSTFKQFGALILDLTQQFKFEDQVDMNSLGND